MYQSKQFERHQPISVEGGGAGAMDDAAMMRYLLGKYGLTDLVAMLRSQAAVDQGSIHSTSTKSIKDGVTNTPFEANPSPISFSDASSITGSLYSTCSDASSYSLSVAPSPIAPHNGLNGQPAPTSSARSIGRKVVRRAAAASKRSNLGGLAGSWGAKKNEPFECPFCKERGITVEIKRKNDLKRHFHEFHTNHSVWTCSAPGCGTPFEWKSAYTNHLKTVHNGIGPLPDDVMVKTCPQVVFACGFVDCKRIFEAQSDEDADKKAHEYFAHVADHFDGDGLTHRDWSFSARFRNLMRQSPVDEAWKRRIKTSTESPCWQALSSFTVRKMLECRHIGDVQQLVQVASALGYAKEGAQPTLPPTFFIPMKGSCQLASVNHQPDRIGAVMEQQQQQQCEIPDIPDFSPFETPLPTFPKTEEDTVSLSKMSMMPAPLNFTPHSMPPDAGAWTTSQEPITVTTTTQDLSNTSFLFLDSDDTMTTPVIPNVPLNARTPTHSFGYWTDLLQSGQNYTSMPTSVMVDEQNPQQQMARAPDPPICPQPHQLQPQQQQQMTAAQKRRWSMRTTSSGKTVVPIRDSIESRPPSTFSSVFHFN